ncbi:Thiosulfate reductase/polysulfide reductase [Candidatus Magnetaquicoccaceae bacterium FCR-1]|uniref:Thiosulfate reductase/polysulfide reductase n=1 Tax=Candidatus Magnetaquiglobus chichijimensis TaxID=3141448 RepID=A0ABQ0C926_9PROT
MPEIRRREFLVASGTLLASAALPAPANAMELELGGKSYHQLRTFHPRVRSHYACTLCPYCDGGFTYAENGHIQKAEGNPDHVATRGKFCAKGLASFLSACDPDRITMPLKRVGPRGSGNWREIGWDEAIAEVAGKVAEALSQPDTIVVNEGDSRDGAAARFLATVGSSSLFRSCAPGLGGAARQEGLRRMVGVSYLLPDLEHARYVLNFGCNILETALPLAQRLTDGLVNNRLKLVTFDVRMSNTAGRSHEWIPVFPGTDGFVALAMCRHILEKGLADGDFIRNWTNTTPEELLVALAPYTTQKAAEISGVPEKSIKRLAVEFAKNKPGAVVTMNGVSRRDNGIDAEQACTLLAVITGNIDNEGGLCLPRQFQVGVPQPAPKPVEGGEKLRLNHTLPFEILDKSRVVKVLFNHLSNPVYSAPAASIWREALKNESLVPLVVDFSPFMSETAEWADLILPDVVGVERHDLVSAPTALWPWVSISQPSVKPVGSARDVRETFKKIVEVIDADGQKGMKPLWAFTSARQWVEQASAATPGLEGNYKKLQNKGFWPDHGKIDPADRKIVKDGEALPVAYHTFQKTGFATPSGKIEVVVPDLKPNPRHARLEKGQFVLATYKVAYHALSMTTNLKYLAEIHHANPLWINKAQARELEIADGDLVRVTSEVGYLVTKAFVTNGVHPKVVGISTSVGRTSYGRVAKADPFGKVPDYARKELVDEDIDDNIWWRDRGVSPNEILPLAVSARHGEQAWNDTVVTVTPADPGDVYGTVHVDNARHLAIFKQMTGHRAG